MTHVRRCAWFLLLALHFLSGFWLLCRLKAQRCPKCDSKWSSELMGDWDREEDWYCHACGHAWGVLI